MTAQMIIMEADQFELGELEPTDHGDRWMMCYLTAEGDNPFDFFGGAIVQGINRDGDVWRDWWVGENGRFRRCPFRETAIETLMEEWAKVNGAITRLEVEAIFKAARPVKTLDFKTHSDKENAK